MKLSKPSYHFYLPALLVLLLTTGGSVLAANTVITNEGAAGAAAPPAEEGSAPPPPPVATEDTAILICPQGGGKNISYEVSSPLQGASCTKDAKNNSVLCERADGFPLLGASCKLGCQVHVRGSGSCTKTESGKVTQ